MNNQMFYYPCYAKPLNVIFTKLLMKAQCFKDDVMFNVLFKKKVCRIDNSQS